MSTAADAVNDLLFAEDNEVPTNHYGQYLLPNPETGEIEPYVRVSTIKNIAEDQTGFATWGEQNIVLGIGLRPDLYSLAASAAGDDKSTLNDVILGAKETAAVKGRGLTKANFGTALHNFTQRLDLGEEGCHIPDEHQADIAAYLQGFKDQGLWVHGRFIEFVAFSPELGIAGTVDRLLMGDNFSKPRIADLKTGSVKGKGYGFAVQEGAYAEMTHCYNPRTKEVSLMPDVDKDRGLIIHLPLGQGTCHFIEVDVAFGRQALHHALALHQGRKRKDLCWPLTSFEVRDEEGTVTAKGNVPVTVGFTDVDTSAEVKRQTTVEVIEDNFDARLEWLKDRVDTIKAVEAPGPEQENLPKKDLAECWGQLNNERKSEGLEEVPTFPKGGPRNHEEIDVIAGVCSVVEMTHGLPFPEQSDPAKQKQHSQLVKDLIK